MILEVFSTKRAIKERNKAYLKQNCMLSPALSFDEFLNKAIIVNGLIRADSNTKILIMQESANAVKAVASELKIPLEFFAFLKSSEYLFAFFSELKRQKVSIEMLQQKDIYANFDEHLQILSQLEKEYLTRLKNAGFYDDISVCELYDINWDFILNYEQINVRVDGILNAYELEILNKISKRILVILSFSISKFNKKLARELEKNCQTSFKSGFAYDFNLSKNEILNTQKLNQSTPDISLQGFELRSLQASFVFSQISKMLENGIEAKNIAVILPDEDFSDTLRNLDKNNMLNYAMGKSVAKTSEFALLVNLQDALKLGLDYQKNDAYLNKEQTPNKTIATLNHLGLLDEHYSYFKNSFFKICEYEKFCFIIDEMFVNTAPELKALINHELFCLKSIANKLKTNEILELFIIALRQKSLSLTGGGEITAMGVLESRSLKFDGVIIIDFNDNLVPQSSKKEMFLSSNIRAKAGLISHKEREDLQRFYYERLIFNAKQVGISYEISEQSVLSRFVSELGLDKSPQIKSRCYEDALLRLCEPKAIINLKPNELICEHDFFANPLSFSRLSTYLSCKRAYYYKYILGISEGVDLSFKLDKSGLGTLIHEILKDYFNENPNFCNDQELKDLITQKTSHLGGLNKLEVELFKLRLNEFALKQNEHFASGYKVCECEKEIQCEFEGIQIKGVIDRIDECAGELLVIDYKSGALPDNDLQLQFYKALSGASQAVFLDLKNSMDFKGAKKTFDLAELIQDLKKINKQEISFMCDEGCKHEHSAFSALYKDKI